MSGASTGPFAGKPAPTGIAPHLKPVQYLWERVYPRKGRHWQHKFNKQSLYHDKRPQSSYFNAFSALTRCFFSPYFYPPSDWRWPNAASDGNLYAHGDVHSPATRFGWGIGFTSIFGPDGVRLMA
jgi:hypothetical protein